jgi:hypothetical protein
MPLCPSEHVQFPPLQLPCPPHPATFTHGARTLRLTKDRLVSTSVTSSSSILPPGFERNSRPPPFAGGRTVPLSRVSSPSTYTLRLLFVLIQSARKFSCATCPAPACTIAQS